MFRPFRNVRLRAIERRSIVDRRHQHVTEFRRKPDKHAIQLFVGHVIKLAWGADLGALDAVAGQDASFL
jgi:hypothetical protein